ncbi:hypothetical protein HDU76_005696 [Blyttiomyces sp. JEL0837]|nr:hypothetical protein HDU76_005696 [Blyttiomyces sp. JEL0837]
MGEGIDVECPLLNIEDANGAVNIIGLEGVVAVSDVNNEEEAGVKEIEKSGEVEDVASLAKAEEEKDVVDFVEMKSDVVISNGNKADDTPVEDIGKMGEVENVPSLSIIVEEREEAVKVHNLKSTSADISIEKMVGVFENTSEVEEVSTVTEPVEEISLGVASASGNAAEAKEVVHVVRLEAASGINDGLSQVVVLEAENKISSLHKIPPIASEDMVTTVNDDGAIPPIPSENKVKTVNDDGAEEVSDAFCSNGPSLTSRASGEEKTEEDSSLTSPKAETDNTSTCDDIAIDKITEINGSGIDVTVTEMDELILCEHEAAPAKDGEAKEI